MTLEPDAVLARNDGLIATEMDGEVVMMSIAKGTYYHLDPVGAEIWEALEQPRSLEDLVARLAAEYDVDEELCRRETRTFLELLLEKGIVRHAER